MASPLMNPSMVAAPNAAFDYNINPDDNSGNLPTTPAAVLRQRAMADALLKQGQDSSPAAGGKWGGLATIFNRGLAGAIGGYENNQATQQENTGRATAQQHLAAALVGGKVDPAALVTAAGDPWANPAQTQAITHVGDMQATKDRQAIEDSHWKQTFDHRGDMTEYQRQQLAMAKDKTPAGFEVNPDFGKVLDAPQYRPLQGGPQDPTYIAAANNAKGAELTPDQKNYTAYLKGFTPTPEKPVPLDFPTFMGVKGTNVTTNVDTKGPDKYDTTISEGIAKGHVAMMNDTEAAATRARDLSAMQGAIDAIQKNGGTTGGLGQQQMLDLKKTINAGASALGIETPFDEKDISDKEFLTKFNRQIAGAQAKGAMGSRVTNFEMANYLKANPGLDMSPTGNQRLIGIQSQIEQRNVAVGRAMRAIASQAIGKGQKVDPAMLEKVITDYDAEHHILDPITGQDLTKSISLPEFGSQNNNPALAADHAANIGKIRTWHPETGVAP